MASVSPFDIQGPTEPHAHAGAVGRPVCRLHRALYQYLRQPPSRKSDDRVVPTAQQLAHGIQTSVFEPAEEDDYVPAEDASHWERFRHSMIVKDTISSGRRFLIATALLIPCVLLALHIGLFPLFGAGLLRFILFFDKIVALSLLPILFIIFGIEDVSKIALIVIGRSPHHDAGRDQHGNRRAARADGEGLHARRQQLRCGLPRHPEADLPQIINSLRLNLKPMMLFLFAGEMIAASDGLAYRIGIMRRHMGMDIILPYVLWVAFLLFMIDLLLRVLNKKLHHGSSHDPSNLPARAAGRCESLR